MYAGRFPAKDRTLWLVVNRTDKTATGNQLAVPNGGKFFDLWHGAPRAGESSFPKAVLNFEVESHGYGDLATQRRSAR